MAILMLVGAVSHNEGAQSYALSQVSELFECLMVSARSWGRGRASRDRGGTSLRAATFMRGTHWKRLG